MHFPRANQPGNRFAQAKCMKSTGGRVTFLVKFQTNDLPDY